MHAIECMVNQLDACYRMVSQLDACLAQSGKLAYNIHPIQSGEQLDACIEPA